MNCHEAWTFEFEAFDGAWALEDCAQARDDAGAVLCVARMLVTRVVADAVRRRIRSEDLDDDVASVEAYVNGLEIAPEARRALRHMLAALRPFDPGRVAEELLRGCAAATAEGHEGSARAFAELAYEAAAAHGVEAGAHGAALALARLATLQEAPWNARKWRAIARMHGRRSARRRFAGA